MADPVSIAINVALVAASMALTASQEFEGPRLDELRMTTADYGTSLSYVYGKRRLDGTSCIWAEPLTEVKRQRKTKGGKFNDYTYFGTWAQLVCDNAVDKILRIWFDRNLVYDATGAGPISPFSLEDFGEGPVGEAVGQLGLGEISQYMTFYLGTEDQEPDPRMAATVDAEFGEGSTPAYRGVTYIVFKDLPLEKLGNRLPQVSVEVATEAADLFPMNEREAALGASTVISLSQDGARAYWTTLVGGAPGPVMLEIWDVRAAALMTSIEREDIDVGGRMGTDTDGRIFIPSAGNTALRVLSPDASTLLMTQGPPDITWGANYLDFPPISAVTALDDVAYCASFSTGSDGWTYTYSADANVHPRLIDTSDYGGASWQAKAFFKDAYGGHWMLGGGGSLASDQLMVVRLQPGVDAPDTVSTRQITMPITNGSAITQCAGFHCKDGEDDYIIVRFGAGDGCIVCLDWATLTIQNQLVSHSLAGLNNVITGALAPGSRYVWINGSQWDFVGMTIVRTVHASSWDAGFVSNQNMLYERLTHAFIRTSGAADFQFLYLDRVSGDGVLLSSIATDVCERAGLIDGVDFDASDLTQTVTGYSWTQGTGKAILGPLLEAYDSEARPHDFLTQFLRRGVAVGAPIPVADMGAGGGVRYTITTLGDSDLPLKVNLTVADVDRDQQANTAIAQRAGAATDSRRELSLDASTLATDADDGRQKAEGYMRREWMRAQTAQTALTRAYTALEPGDARSLVCDDVTISAKLKKLEFGANGVLSTEWERYAPSIHQPSALSGAPADGLAPDEIPVFGYTKGLALDIPLVVDPDEATQPFVYLAAAPYGDTTWPGATFYRSDDNSNFDEELGAVAASQRATIGYALSALPDALATCWDNASTVSVKLFDGELTSSTKALVGNGANRALLGGEIIGFTTATLIATDTYQLSGLIRGRRGTEWATGAHASGDTFVLLDSLPKATMSSSDVDADVYVRPTTSGGPNGFTQHLNNYTGAALKPYAPAHLEVENSGGDKVVTWTRRTRIGGTWRDYQDVPLGEGSEAYLGRILSAGGSIIRTFSGLSSPTFTYTAAQQATDGSPAGATVEVAQVSATVGNGYFAEAAL